ncbi:agamous-like MADS-box protein AGL80 [Nicotiana tabacum]|uniref:Agamous-like MADS-box protein AGL80 n=1 Tax=Nicotiana tabacum TaxID=4097 RepID=A0AC58SI93_TOBAC
MSEKGLKNTNVCSERKRKAKEKRKIATLFKMADELSTLCEAIVTIIIFSPGETFPIVWPDESEAMVRVTKYLGHSEYERSKKLVLHETYLEKQIKNLEEENNRKIARKSKEKEMEILFNQLFEGKMNTSDLDVAQTEGLLKLSARIKAKLDERKKQLNQQEQTSDVQCPSTSSNATTEGHDNEAGEKNDGLFNNID